MGDAGHGISITLRVKLPLGLRIQEATSRLRKGLECVISARIISEFREFALRIQPGVGEQEAIDTVRRTILGWPEMGPTESRIRYHATVNGRGSILDLTGCGYSAAGVAQVLRHLNWVTHVEEPNSCLKIILIYHDPTVTNDEVTERIEEQLRQPLLVERFAG